MGNNSKDLRKSLTTGDGTTDTALTGGYEQGYKGEKFGFWGQLGKVIGSAATMEGATFWGNWNVGKQDGKQDRKAGRINKLNPESSIKRNEPIIKLKEKNGK